MTPQDKPGVPQCLCDVSTWCPLHDANPPLTPPPNLEPSAPALIGWMILEDYCDDMSDWSGVISYPDPTGANLAWESPIKMIEHSHYLQVCAERDEARALTENFRTGVANFKCFNCGDYRSPLFPVNLVSEINKERARSLKLREALEEALDTIHDEFCGSGTHHPLCERPRKALEEEK